MDLRVRAIGFQMTPATSEYLNQKLAMLEKHLGEYAELARCEVELGRASGDRHSEYAWFAEIQLAAPGMKRIVARNQEPTINAAIDQAQAEAATQLRRAHRLHSRVIRKTGAAIKRWMRLDGE